MDRLESLERHQHEERHDHENNRQLQTADRPFALPPQRHDYRPVPAGAAAVGAACLSGAPVVGLMVIPFCASSSRSLSSLCSTAAAASARISASLRRPSWMLWLINCWRWLTSACTERFSWMRTI